MNFVGADLPRPGFSFDNCGRNEELVKMGFEPPAPRKTGTTIVGVVFKDGVVLGADTRATDGHIIFEKNCQKIHYLQPNMYCCGAGVAADAYKTTSLISSQLELLRLDSNRNIPVAAATHLFKKYLYRYDGNLGCALILGGVDYTGPHLFCVHPHGSIDKVPFASMGSGCLAAMGFLENRWKRNLGEAQAAALVRDAVRGGVLNDLGSGTGVDLCVIRKNCTDMLRNYQVISEKGRFMSKYKYPKGTTEVISKTVHFIPCQADTSILN